MRKSVNVVAALVLFTAVGPGATGGSIHDAVKAGNLAQVQALVAKDASLLEARDEQRRTPLHWAARGTNLAVLRWLVEQGADVGSLDGSGVAPLHSLASRGNLEGIRIVLARGADVNVALPNKSTPLHQAALGRQVETVRLLVERKADLERADEQGRTPLLVAAREMAGPSVVRTLLDLGARIDVADRSGWTALELAGWRGSADVVAVLLERGAVFETAGPRGARLLEFAVSGGLTDLFSKMIERGADVNAQLPTGRTLLHSAAEGGAVGIMDVLLKKGLNINARDVFGWTPLHFAADLGRQAAIELLVSRGADRTVLTTMGQSVYNVADDNADEPTKAFLAARGFDQGPARFPDLGGSYLGQKPPGTTSAIFAPGIVSARYDGHSTVVFSTDGLEAFWSVQVPSRTSAYSLGRTLVSRLVGGRWTYPRPAVFDGTALDDVPFFHPAGTRLYDMSDRPFPGGRSTGKENIWAWDKGANGWTRPTPVGQAVNGVPLHWQFSVDRDGTIYFSTNVPGTRGGSDIFRSRVVNGEYQAPENLGPGVNTGAGEEFPYVTPDGRLLLFGRDLDIYVSVRDASGHWEDGAASLDRRSTRQAWSCCRSSTGRQVPFFTRNQRVFWVDASVIEGGK